MPSFQSWFSRRRWTCRQSIGTRSARASMPGSPALDGAALPTAGKAVGMDSDVGTDPGRASGLPLSEPPSVGCMAFAEDPWEDRLALGPIFFGPAAKYSK